MSEAGRPRQHYNVTVWVLIVSAMAVAMPQVLITPVLPVIQDALDTNAATSSWLLTGYLLSASVSAPIAGRLGDMYGKERVMVAVLVLVTISTVITALAPSIGVMIGGRAISGTGNAVFPLAYAIIRDEFPREKIAGAIGVVSSVLAAGGGLGMVLAGPINDAFGFRWLFWGTAILALTAVVLTHLFIPESPIRTRAKIDWLGAALMSVGIGGLLVAVSQGSSWGWTSGTTVGLGMASLVVICAWVVTELRIPEPLVDMAMMRIRGVWTVNLAAVSVGIGMYSSLFLIPQLVELPVSTGFGFGASVTEAGLFMLPATVVMFFLGARTGGLERRFGSRTLLLAGTLVLGLAYLGFAAEHGTRFSIYAWMALMGVGMGLSFSALPNLIVQVVDQSQTGVATGMNNVMRTLGGAGGAAIVASLLASNRGSGGFPADRGFTLSFLFCGAAVLIAGALTILVPTQASARRPAAAERDAVQDPGVLEPS